MTMKNLLTALRSRSQRRLAVNPTVRASTYVSTLDLASPVTHSRHSLCHSRAPPTILMPYAAVVQSFRVLKAGGTGECIQFPNQFTGPKQMQMLSKRSFTSASDEKPKTEAEENQAIHESLWKPFFKWLGGLPGVGSRLGMVFNKAAGVRICFLERIHGEPIGFRRRTTLTNDEAMLKMMNYAASKTSAFSLGLLGNLFKLIWIVIKELGKGIWFFGFVGAVFASLTAEGGKMWRAFQRSLGLDVEEPIDVKKVVGVVQGLVGVLSTDMDQMKKRVGGLSTDMDQMKKSVFKIEVDVAIAETLRRR